MNAARWTEHLGSVDQQRSYDAKRDAVLALVTRALPAEDAYSLDGFWTAGGALFRVEVVLYDAHTDSTPARELERTLQALATDTFGTWVHISTYGDAP